MADSPDRLGEVLERCAQFLKELDGGEILDQQIHTRITYANGHVLKGAAPIKTGDLEVLAHAFMHMNQEPDQFSALTKAGISVIPNEGAGSQLNFPGITEMVERLDGQLAVNRIQSEAIANLVLLLKEK